MFYTTQIHDKRVDRILLRKGCKDANIFYSPIGVWFFLVMAYLLPVALPVIIMTYNSLWILLLLPYLLIAYLLNAYHCCSFALVEGMLCIINPNWPFREFREFKLDQIESVTIAEHRKQWMSVFVFSGSNYVELKTGNGKERFYCAYLQLDAFDENFTEQTIEDFQYALERSGIPVQMDLE